MVTHVTTQALFMLWVGATRGGFGSLCAELGIPTGMRACSPAVPMGDTHRGVWFHSVLQEIPTCPRCAVLYDEAMTAREELLGRKEAA